MPTLVAATKSLTGEVLSALRFHHGRYGQAQRDESAGDGSGASAAVGLDDIAIDEDGALAQFIHVGHGPRERPIRR